MYLFLITARDLQPQELILSDDYVHIVSDIISDLISNLESLAETVSPSFLVLVDFIPHRVFQ